MKLFVFGTFVLAAAVTAGLAAQGGGAATEQTIMGCVAGEGTEASPWMLTGVVIPPPAPAPAGRGGGGGGGGRGGGRGDAPAAGAGAARGDAAAGGAARGGGDAAARGGGGGRGAGRGAPAGPPPPPPPPQNFKLNGINMTPWQSQRAEVTGTGTTAGFNVTNVRSMWGSCPPKLN